MTPEKLIEELESKDDFPTTEECKEVLLFIEVVACILCLIGIILFYLLEIWVAIFFSIICIPQFFITKDTYKSYLQSKQK